MKLLIALAVTATIACGGTAPSNQCRAATTDTGCGFTARMYTCAPPSSPPDFSSQPLDGRSGGNLQMGGQ